MTRPLTNNERNVLAHKVIDPDAWWEHAQAATNVDPEQAIAAKVARWQAEYDAAVLALGVNYKTRAQLAPPPLDPAESKARASAAKLRQMRARSLLDEGKTAEALELLGLI